MAVNWLWKHEKGQILIKDFGKKYKIGIYGGNCLGALIYRYKDKDTKENMYQF